jgi:hypothetical protein
MASDVLRDVAGVPADPREHVGRGRELEHEAGEVEPRRRRGDAALVHGLTRLVQDRQVEPREVVHEAGAPDDVRHVELAAVVEQRPDAPRAYDPRDALDPRSASPFDFTRINGVALAAQMSQAELSEHLETGRKAYADRAWADAYRSLADADRAAPLAPGDLERFATSAAMTGLRQRESGAPREIL